MTTTLRIHRPSVKHRFRRFRGWLANVNRRPYLPAETFRRWAEDYGLPATEGEFRAALEGGLIAPPSQD